MVSEVYYVDNMEYMSTLPDKFFDLAPVDPPYGIGMGGGITGELKTNFSGSKKTIIEKQYYMSNFDDSKIPDKKYFDELFRISKNQIIWGGNYFLEYLKNTSCFIVWDKDNGNSDQADCELAWTSFETATRKLKYRWHGLLQENMKNKEKRIHPTQKPIALYKWLLQNYAQPGWKIFDSHVGSGSSRIACYDMGFDFIGCENDPDYWQAQEDRFKRHLLKQGKKRVSYNEIWELES